MEIVNWRLASHPMNYVTLFMMVFIFLLGVHLVQTYMRGQ